jgi:hypothetical protein
MSDVDLDFELAKCQLESAEMIYENQLKPLSLEQFIRDNGLNTPFYVNLAKEVGIKENIVKTLKKLV